MNDDKLLRKLIEDLGSHEDAHELLSILTALNQGDAPANTSMLTERLRAELPPSRSWREWRAVALLLSQLRIIRRDLWLASFMLMALGLALTLTQADSLVFAMIAPFVAAGGVAFLYGANEIGIEELENSTRTPAPLLLLARLALLFTFDLLVALACSAILALVLPDVSLMPLIGSWFAPMTFLSTFAFFLSVMLLDTFASIMFSMLLWTTHLILRMHGTASIWLSLLSLPGLTAPETRPLLLLAAGALLLGAFAYLFQREPR